MARKKSYLKVEGFNAAGELVEWVKAKSSAEASRVAHAYMQAGMTAAVEGSIVPGVAMFLNNSLDDFASVSLGGNHFAVVALDGGKFKVWATCPSYYTPSIGERIACIIGAQDRIRAKPGATWD